MQLPVAILSFFNGPNQETDWLIRFWGFRMKCVLTFIEPSNMYLFLLHFSELINFFVIIFPNISSIVDHTDLSL